MPGFGYVPCGELKILRIGAGNLADRSNAAEIRPTIFRHLGH